MEPKLTLVDVGDFQILLDENGKEVPYRRDTVSGYGELYTKYGVSVGQ